MAHVLKMSIWKSATGLWSCADVEDLAHDSGVWWLPCRLLGIAPTDYILLLKEKYNATKFYYNKEKNNLLFYWEKEADAKRFKNDINALARKKNFII